MMLAMVHAQNLGPAPTAPGLLPDVAAAIASAATITRSPSFSDPPVTSVNVPSVSPVLITTLCGVPLPSRTQTVFSATTSLPTPGAPRFADCSDAGWYRSTALGTLSTFERRVTRIFTFAVMPGNSFSSEFDTPTTASYVITFCTLIGALANRRHGPRKRPARIRIHGE